MAFQLKTECVTCGHSIPLGGSYCGGNECLNRYASDNEHPDYSYADYQAWQAVATEAHAGADYHEWAVAHRNLAELESAELPDPHDAQDLYSLRHALYPSSKAAA